MPCEGSRSELKLGKNEEEIPSAGDAECEPGVRSGWCAQVGWTAPGEGPGGHTGARALFGLPRNNHGVLSQGTTKGSRAGHGGPEEAPYEALVRENCGWTGRARAGEHVEAGLAASLMG